jgi:hypothetical protein
VIAILRWVWFLMAFLALFVGGGMVYNALTGRDQSPGTLAVIGLLGLLGALAFDYATKRGWIRGIMWNRAGYAAGSSPKTASASSPKRGGERIGRRAAPSQGNRDVHGGRQRLRAQA